MSEIALADYITCVSLLDVDDVFEIDQFWRRAKPGFSLFGSPQTKRRGCFLLEALEQHLYTPRDKFRQETRFCHINLFLPQQAIDKDRLLDESYRTKTLKQQCETRHLQDLKKYLPKNQNIHYQINAGQRLEVGEIRFQFGRAIYLANQDEKPIYELLFSQDQVSWQGFGHIYTNQRITIINGDRYHATHAIPNWPFSPHHSLILLYDAEKKSLAFPETLPDNRLQVAANGQHIYKISHDQQSLWLQCRPIQQAPKPSEPTKDKRKSFWNKTKPSAVAELDNTWQPNFVNEVDQPQIHIVGIALQRISVFASRGIQAWQLNFDAQGQITTQPEHIDNTLFIDRKDRLYNNHNSQQHTLSIPGQWQINAEHTLALHPLPKELQAIYLGWLSLPEPTPLSLIEDQSVILGRGEGADLKLGWFEDQQMLHWQPGFNPEPNMTAERLNFSRQHLQLTLQQQLTIRLIGQSVVFQLSDDTQQTLAQLTPQQKTKTLALDAGQHIVIGSYILKYLQG